MHIPPYSGKVLRNSAIHFLTGKTASALLTFIILLSLVRLLTVEEYAVYMVLIAIRELVPPMVTLGIPWIVARYLPEYRMYASGKMLTNFVWLVIIRILQSLTVGILLLFVTLPWLSSSLDLTQYISVIKLYLMVILLEGLGQFIRRSVLGSLLQQGYAQISLVVRNLSLVLLIGVMARHGIVYLHHVVLIELVASMLGTALALYGLMQHLHTHRKMPGNNSWQPPAWQGMWRIACHMYFSHLVKLSYSPQVFIFLVQRYLGVEATALFGFLRNLVGQITQYLPATLLFSIIQPKLVASYVSAGGMDELRRNANLAGKLSLFFLMPVLVLTWFTGEELLSLLSGKKFSESGYYLAGLLLMLIPLSQHQILSTVAVVSDNSHLNTWASFLGILSLPLAYWLLEVGFGLWGVIIAMIASQMIFNATLIAALVHTTMYRPDTIGFFKMMISALGVFILLQQLVISAQGSSGILIIAVLDCVLFLLAAYFLKPFRKEERERINQLIKRKIFI